MSSTLGFNYSNKNKQAYIYTKRKENYVSSSFPSGVAIYRNRGHHGVDDPKEKIKIIEKFRKRSHHHSLYGNLCKNRKSIRQVCENRILDPGVGYVWRRY